MSRSRGRVAPTVSSTASCAARSSSGSIVRPTSALHDEPDALGLELVDPAVDVVLGHLEVGDAVGQQPAGPVVALVDGDRVPGAAELLGGGQARRAAADDRHALAGLVLRRHGADPAHLPALVDDRRLDVLDRHRPTR